MLKRNIAQPINLYLENLVFSNLEMALCFFLAFERKYWIQCSRLDSLSVVARSSFTVLINDALDL